MKKLLFLFFVISIGMCLMHNQIPGGWFTTTPDNNVDQYIRQNIKSLSDAKLSKT